MACRSKVAEPVEVMQFEVRGQDELLSLLTEAICEIRELNGLLRLLGRQMVEDDKKVGEEKPFPAVEQKVNKRDVMRRYRKGESMTSISKSYGCDVLMIWKIVQAGLV